MVRSRLMRSIPAIVFASISLATPVRADLDMSTLVPSGDAIALENAVAVTDFGTLQLQPFAAFSFHQAPSLMDTTGTATELERLFKHDYRFTIPNVGFVEGGASVLGLTLELPGQPPLVDIRQLTLGLFRESVSPANLINPPGLRSEALSFEGLVPGDYVLRVAGVLNGYDSGGWHGEYQGNVAIQIDEPPPPLTISRIIPDRGGDTGPVTARIVGTTFQGGATVKLVRDGQPDIVGDPVTVENSSTIVTTFDLVGAARGLWGLIVTNPGGATFTLAEAFTVQAGEEDQVSVDIIGRPFIRPGRPQRYWIVYRNRGNTDSKGTVIEIKGPPQGSEVEAPETIPPPPFDAEPPPHFFDDVPVAIENPDQAEVAAPFVIPTMPPGQDLAFPLDIKVNETTPFEITVRSRGQSFSLINILDTTECFTDAIRIFLPPGLSCAADAVDYFTGDFLYDFIYNRNRIKVERPTSVTHSLFDVFKNCAASRLRTDWIKYTTDVTNFSLDTLTSFDSCRRAFPDQPGGTRTVLPVTSFDPNDKVGPQGSTASRYISAEETLRYAVFMENLETATAPAREVVVTDQLDPEAMDLTTFNFGPISLGTKLVDPPIGSRQFGTMVDMRPEQHQLVRIAAGLDETTGVVTWRFTSLDPATGQPPDDPLAGFLPPNVNPPEGEGSVLFTIQPKAGLPTGTEILNDAEIIFDTNEPIVTPVWFNTIDNSDPVSAVGPLAPVQGALSFEVAWSGDDEGAGVRDFSVFVSEDGGPFAPWLVNTPSTAANFVGEDGGRYAFYSLARDLVGNLEEKAPTVEAETLVQLAPADSDGDGVPDEEDSCPDSILTSTVVIDQCDSGVPNTVLENGCTISDRIAEEAALSRNHGQFVSRVARLTDRLRATGVINGQQSGAIQSCAAQADLP